MLRLYVDGLDCSREFWLYRRCGFSLGVKEGQLGHLGCDFLPDGLNRDLHLQLGAEM